MRDLPAYIECFSCIAGIICNLHCTQFNSILLDDISRYILQARFNDFNQLICLIRLKIDPRQSYKVNTPSDVARTIPTLDWILLGSISAKFIVFAIAMTINRE